MLRPTWDPFADVSVLRDQINRLFDESVSRVPARDRREGLPQRAWSPAVDVYEDQDKITLEMDLPGMSQADIHLEIEGDTLTVRGERKLEEQGNSNCLRAERISGPFMRSFNLVTPVQSGKVTATYREGVLKVTIPKAEETKPRRIQIAATA